MCVFEKIGGNNVKKKKLLAVLLAMTMVFSACANNSGSSDDDDDDDEETKPKKTKVVEDNGASPAEGANDLLEGLFGGEESDNGGSSDGNGGFDPFGDGNTSTEPVIDDFEYPEVTTAPADTEATETTTTADPNEPVIIKRDNSFSFSGINSFGTTLFTNSKAFITVGKDGTLLADVSDLETSYRYYDLCDNGSVVAYNSDLSDFTVFNAKGEITVSPAKQEFDRCIAYTEGCILVFKADTSFSGDTYYLGTLDYSGNWLKPKAEVTADINFKNLNGAIVRENNADDFLVLNKASRGILVYNMNKGTVIFDTDDNNISYPSSYTWYLDAQYLSVIGGSKYDLKTGERKSAGAFYTYDSLYKNEIIKDDIFYGYYYGDDRKNHYCLFNKDFKIVTPLDNYKIYNDNYLGIIGETGVAVAQGASSGVYLCFIKNDGSTAFEPIKLSDSDYISFDYYKVFDNCVVYQIDNDTTVNIVDASGNVNQFTVDSQIKAIDPNSGIYMIGSSSKYSIYDSTGKNIVTIK